MQTQIINTYEQKLAIKGTSLIQIQIEQQNDSAFITLSRDDARRLAIGLIVHCDKGDSNKEDTLMDFKDWWNNLPDESDDKLAITFETIDRFLNQ